MYRYISLFEKIVRRSHQFTDETSKPEGGLHPFDERNIHPIIAGITKSLFDDGHFSQATFEAYKFIDNEIGRHSKSSETGFKLMMSVLSEVNPIIKMTPNIDKSDKDEQKGYQFLFAGSMLAIRNPRGHKLIIDWPDKCLDHLGLASLLLRRLEEAGYK